MTGKHYQVVMLLAHSFRFLLKVSRETEPVLWGRAAASVRNVCLRTQIVPILQGVQ
jgi:hypothetical protein